MTQAQSKSYGGVKKKLMGAICMLLVASIMVVSSTYAWFTLSTAPEVKNISTTVAGNGSLEIALMPTSGLFKDLKNGYSSTENGGTTPLATANTTWGNIVQLNDNNTYGLDKVTLNPAQLNVDATDVTKLADSRKPLAIAVYG